MRLSAHCGSIGTPLGFSGWCVVPPPPPARTCGLSSADLLQDDEAERSEADDIRKKVFLIKCIMRELPASSSKDMSLREELGVSLDSLVEGIEKEVATQDKMREACVGHRDNVLAKFMVSVQLKDNMLRSYNLTRAHQKSEYISPIF